MVCDILDFIDNNILRNVSIQEIADTLSFNRYYVMKRFKKEMGVSIIDYINKIRIFNSLCLLRESNRSIILVSMDSGFQSLNYYSEIFKKIVGVSPSSYRKFCNYRMDNYTGNIIRKNLGELLMFMNFVEEYRKKRRPKKMPVMVRSIFCG